jgi:hypothetical protein
VPVNSNCYIHSTQSELHVVSDISMSVRHFLACSDVNKPIVGALMIALIRTSKCFSIDAAYAYMDLAEQTAKC